MEELPRSVLESSRITMMADTPSSRMQSSDIQNTVQCRRTMKRAIRAAVPRWAGGKDIAFVGHSCPSRATSHFEK
eukprot:1936440-Prymnesium_polylepis.1